jgi:E3 ubiquitin-protein ligase TRIP12
MQTLEKISVEFPSVIVREGGLTACLSYLDFFATSTQRTAVTTAANCCRNIAQESFPVIKDVMPILLNVLGSNDQKVVEQGSLCVSRIVESFKYHQDKLEELISTNLLKAIRRLLVPGTTNLIGPNIHSQFLSVLAITAHASPALSVELFKMNIVDTIYQFLTGVSPPQGVENVASQIDSILIMQALNHKPREQVYETLNFICELLPGIQSEGLSFHDDLFDVSFTGDDLIFRPDSKPSTSPNAKRIQLLEGCKEELKRFAIVLMPTLTDAYSSTVNLSVRQRVLTAQLKMLSNLDTSILEDALRAVPYASYLASILSQQDHPTLVAFALQAAELLLVRLEKIYRFQFYREGVMAEIAKLAKRNLNFKTKVTKTETGIDTSMAIESEKGVIEHPADKATHDDRPEDNIEPDDEDEDEDDEDGSNDIRDDMSPSPSDSSSSDQNYTSQSLGPNLQDYITASAKKILEVHEDSKGTDMRDKATAILNELQILAKDIGRCYLGDGEGNSADLFVRLSSHFSEESLESITSFELLHSQVAQVLLDIFSNTDGRPPISVARTSPANKSTELLNTIARKDFLEVFMRSAADQPRSQDLKASSTPFSVLVHKLQDLLSRAEHFEVRTVRYNASESNRTHVNSILAKQIKLNLSTDDESGTPRPYRNVIISIHAIATFQNLDEYLRPRISLSERPRSARHREGVTNALAAFAAAAGLPNPGHMFIERGDTTPGNVPIVPSQPSTAVIGRGARRVSKTKGGTSASDLAPVKEKVVLRRSSRRYQPASQSSSEVIPKSPEETQTPLECADEREVTDEDGVDDSNSLDAIVDDLQDRMEAPNVPEPSAVNMEVAPTGKVTARKDDGTRVSTPSQILTALTSAPSSRSRDLLPAGISPAIASRALSYAAATQAVPQDWHLEFSVRGQPVSNETTIYQAVADRYDTAEASNRHVWNAIHEVNFKRVPGPPAPRPSTITASRQASDSQASQGPSSLYENSETSIILRLLNILHETNANLDDVLDESQETMKLGVEPLAQFVNAKLTAKLNRQLEEPLIVASNCLPSWSQDLARLYPFLFPFETRHLFLQSTSFGYCRSVARWQSAQPAEETRRERHREDRPFVNRIQRQKVRIARARFLESALKVMELYGASPSILEIEYFEEVGTGLGPTLEFYSTVSKEFSRKDIKLWRNDESNPKDVYVFSKLGLFPSPMSVEHAETAAGKRTLHLFKMLGKFIARSMLDSRIIDVSFNPTFFRIINHPTALPLSLGALKTVDSHLAKSLKLLKQFATAKRQIDENINLSNSEKAEVVAGITLDGVRVEDLGLDFVLPGEPTLELVLDGGSTPVTIENVGAYVEKVIDMTLGSGVQQQIDAFKAGFSQVFPSSALQAFTPDELVMLFGRNEEDWSLESRLYRRLR